MSGADNRGAGSGIGFFAVLGLIFVTLRLTDVIDWPWALVTFPFWGPYAATGIALVTIAVWCRITRR